MARRRRAHVARTLLAALTSAGLIVITSVVAVGPTAQASTSGAESTGRIAVDAADTSASTPCVVSINAPKCQSTDSHLTVDVVNTGDTSACTFTYSIVWGDGSAAQQVKISGESQSGEFFLADHTYHTTQTRTYSIAASPELVTGNCTSGSGSYTFTLEVGSAQAVKYYAAMGDSYSSGLGNPPYPYSRICHESAQAYPALLHADVPALGKLGFIACAGAVTDDFYTTGTSLSQLASLALLHNVRTVTLTIGGNDIGFVPVVKACLDQRTDCYKAKERVVGARINALAGKGSAATPDSRPIHAMTALLAAIHREAPNAHIFVAGYPRLFGSNSKYYTLLKGHNVPGTRVCYLPTSPLAHLAPLFVRYDDAQWFNRVADRLNGTLARAVAKARHNGVTATFVSVRAAFTTHGDCDSGPSWLTPVNAIGLGSSGLHPNANGQQAYERNLRSAGT